MLLQIYTLSKHKGGQRQVHDAVLYILWLAKRLSYWDEATSNSEEIKPVALFIVELCWAGGIR